MKDEKRQKNTVVGRHAKVGVSEASSSAVSPRRSVQKCGAHAASHAASAASTKRRPAATSGKAASRKDVPSVRKAAPASRKRMPQMQASVATSARKAAPQTRKSVRQAHGGGRATPRARAHSAGKPRKMMALLVSAALVLTFGVGGVYAWITLQTPEIENSFTPGTISCQVQETFDGTTKSDVSIKNTGDQPEYMRATIVVNWVDDSYNVNAQQPVLGTDYTLALGSSWTQGSDGFYYYNTAVSPGQATPMLITSAQQIAEGPSGFKLDISVLAECVQAEPALARAEAWGV